MTAFSAGRAGAADQTPEAIFEKSRPATLMIVAHFQAKASVPEATFAEDKAAYLHQRIAVLLQLGVIPRTKSAIMQAALQIVLSEPMTFFVAGDKIETRDAGFTAIGTGWVITPDGYVVTNAHVAAPDRDHIEQQLIAIGLHDLVERDAANTQKELAGILGGDISAQYHDLLVAAIQKFDQTHLTLSNETHTFSAVDGTTSAGGVDFHSTPAEVTASVGSETPGKDVAILKLEGSNFATLPIGDDAALSVGDRLYVMGFPGAATFHPLLEDGAAAQTEPTFTTGIVSARKPMQGGWSVIQTDAAATHGNSGGPVFDANGKVVGILTFASSDATTGAEVQGFNFVVPISIVKEFLDRLNVKPARSIVNDGYEAALASYHGGHYRRALEQFTAVDRLSPGHPYIARYVALAQQAVDEGKDRGWMTWWPAMVAALTILVISFALVRRRGPFQTRAVAVPALRNP
jgi:serine protease Do